MVKKLSRLSPLEWEIMNVIWDLGGEPSVREVIEKKYPKGEKAYTTIQTVMNNLEQKGYLTKEMIGLVNFYKPTRKRDETLMRETGFIAEKVFRGSVMDMANFMLRSSSLTKEEINDLKKIIRKKEKELKGDRS